jgi:hypothetical protein
MDDKQKGTTGEYYLLFTLQRALTAEVFFIDTRDRKQQLVLYIVNKRKEDCKEKTNVFCDGK